MFSVKGRLIFAVCCALLPQKEKSDSVTAKHSIFTSKLSTFVCLFFGVGQVACSGCKLYSTAACWSGNYVDKKGWTSLD